MFYLVMKSSKHRNELIKHLRAHDIMAVFHYQSLHQSKYGKIKFNTNRELPESDKYTDQLVRLPLFMELTDDQVELISNHILDFFKLNNESKTTLH